MQKSCGRYTVYGFLVGFALLAMVWPGFADGVLGGSGTAVSPAQSLITLDPVDCAISPSPVVGFEVSKGQNANDAAGFLTDLQTDGFSVGTVDLRLGAIPACVDVLIIRGLAGNLTLTSAYTPGEAAMLRDWTAAGHGLMVSGDWGVLKDGSQSLFAAFGVLQAGDAATYVTDPTDNDPTAPGFVGDAWVLYQPDNFTPHPIFAGAETLELLLSGWLTESDSVIVRSDADASPALVPVMAARSEGSGCVLLATDSNWFAVYNEGYQRADNARIARQSAAWLNGCHGLVLAKTAVPNPVQPNNLITYTLTTANFELAGQTNVLVTDHIPANTAFESATTPYTGPDTDGAVVWSLGALPPNTSATLTLTVRVNDNTADGTVILNTAVVTSSEDLSDSATAVVWVENYSPPPVITRLTYLPAVMNNFCQETIHYSDIALGLDTSGSMETPTEPGGPSKLQAARNAAAVFLNLMTFPGDQAAVVLFSGTAELSHPLSSDLPGLLAALNGDLPGGTRLDLALQTARVELTGPRHVAGHNQVFILLTDGLPFGIDAQTVLNEAALTKAAGVTIYTIGLGSDVNATLLQAVATTPQHYYAAPSTSQLNDIYTEIAGLISCP